MGLKKPGLTLEEHDKLGAELQVMRDRLVDISVSLGKAYPNAKLKGVPGKAWKVVDDLRSLLDGFVFQEYRDRDTQELSQVYYRATRPDYKKSR